MANWERAKVLLVDDEPDKRQLLAFALQVTGYDVYTAENGLEGLKAVEAHDPDLVITDVMMPQMDGYEMARRLRADPRTRFIPIIQSAARQAAQDVRRGAEAGALGYVVDPTDLDLLLALARALLEFKLYLDELEEAAYQRKQKLKAEREQEVRSKRLAGAFDVFLCYNNKDREAVRDIAFKLKSLGILPWFDEWELRPGFPFQDALERQIDNINSAAVFVGQNGIGPWQRQEIDSLLRQFIERGCPVIPVVLDGAPQKPSLPNFLGNMTWVDFRRQEPDPLIHLVSGITGESREYGQPYI